MATDASKPNAERTAGYSHLPASIVAALPKLSPKAVRVAVALGSFADKAGRCWPSVQTIGERAGIRREKTTLAALRELEAAGLIGTRRRRRQSSIYQWATPNHEQAESARTKIKTRHKAPGHDGLEQALECVHEQAESASENIPMRTCPKKRPRAPKAAGVNPWKLWIDVWREERQGAPDPAPIGPDTKAAKRVALYLGGEDEIKAVFKAYLLDADPFLQKQGHALRQLLGRLGAYRKAGNHNPHNKYQEGF